MRIFKAFFSFLAGLLHSFRLRRIKSSFDGKTALVTGASSGIGTQFANQLAEAGCNLIIVARRKEILQKLARKLTDCHHIDVDIIDMDLTQAEAPEKLLEKIDDMGKKVDLLVNNAGIGLHGSFIENKLDDELNMLRLNIMALVELTHRFAAHMASHGKGRILLVSSLVGYTPVPGFAGYGASKAFVTSFGTAINQELKKSKISVTVLCPGGTKTEFWSSAGVKTSTLADFVLMNPERTAGIGLVAAAKNKRLVVAGYSNAVSGYLLRLIPDWIRLGAAESIMKMVGKKTGG